MFVGELGNSLYRCDSGFVPEHSGFVLEHNRSGFPGIPPIWPEQQVISAEKEVQLHVYDNTALDPKIFMWDPYL